MKQMFGKRMLSLASLTWLISGLPPAPLWAEININPPEADFSGSPVSGYAPLIVSFTDLSTSSPDSWSWELGDGQTSAEQHPVTIYSDAGSYTVSLTVGNWAGFDTLTRSGYINASPCPNLPVRSNDRYYNSIQAAYDDIVTIYVGGDPIPVPIEIQGTDFVEDLYFNNMDLLAVLGGGYNCEYTDSVPGGTKIYGSVTIAGGAAQVENLVIR